MWNETDSDITPVDYDIYNTPIYDFDSYYDFDGELVHDDNIFKYLKEHQKIATDDR